MMNDIRIEQIFPTLIVILNLLSSLMYVVKGDFPRSVYWFGGFILTFAITYLIK